MKAEKDEREGLVYVWRMNELNDDNARMSTQHTTIMGAIFTFIIQLSWKYSGPEHRNRVFLAE